jgi:hypothetical protein
MDLKERQRGRREEDENVGRVFRHVAPCQVKCLLRAKPCR